MQEIDLDMLFIWENSFYVVKTSSLLKNKNSINKKNPGIFLWIMIYFIMSNTKQPYQVSVSEKVW